MTGTSVRPGWTFSRSRALGECARRYWYEAHLARHGAADSAPVAAKLARRLDGAWTFEELVADVVRRAIVADLVDHWQGRPGDPDPDLALGTLRQYWRESRTRWASLDDLENSAPPRRYRPIAEILYGAGGPDALKELAADAATAVRAWIQCDSRKVWLATSPQSIGWFADPAAPNDLPELPIGVGRIREAPLLVKTLDSGQFEIGDLHWQRGDEPSPRGRRAVHALWASQALNVEPERLTYRTLILPAAREEVGPIQGGDVESVRERVVRESETMARHAELATGPGRDVAGRFDRRDAPEACDPCRFRRLCPKSDTDEHPWVE